MIHLYKRVNWKQFQVNSMQIKKNTTD